MMSFQSLRVLAGACLASGSEPGWELFATSSSAEDTVLTCFSTPGMPSQVDGTYVVSGPARWQEGEYALQGLFDGYGKANKFRIAGGQVCHASKWMNTSIARAGEAAGYTPGMLFEETVPQRPSCPLLHPMCQVNQLVDNNWVNMIRVGGRVVMLSDTPHMIEMDLDTLDVKGNFEWSDDMPSNTGPVMNWALSGHVVASGSAHPLPFANSNTIVDIVTEVAEGIGKSYLDVYTFQSDATGAQPRTRIAQLPFSKAPYLHSFGVTENYIILPISQKMGIPSMEHPVLLGKITMEWQGIYVLDKDGNTVGLFTEMQPFVHVHVVNSFDVTDESGTRVVIDLGAYPDTPFQKTGAMDIPMFLDKASRDSNTGRATLQRVTMYLTGDKAGQAEIRRFATTWNAHADFYRMNPSRHGQEYCYFYATEWWHDGSNYANMAIMKYNVCDDTTLYWSKANFYPGEPFFVPTGGSGEDDGVVIFIAIDGQRGASSFITLDAKTMSEVDGASVNLPFHIPFTAHGEFISNPASELMV